jgi:hypothetical protein
MTHLHFNLWAVLASGGLMWVLGALWYSPVAFSKPWMALVPGPQGDKKKAMIAGMIMSLVGDILLAFVLAHVIIWAGSHEFVHGVFIGFVMWMGFFAAVAIPQGIFEGRPFKLFAINQGYNLLGLMLMGGVLSVWR